MSDLHEIFDALVSASSHGRFEAVLMETPLATATLRSHPLGFKVALISNGIVHLRLHLWTSPTEQPGFEIHDHSFDLKSHVVEGSLRQIIYRAHNNPAGDRSIYQVAYEDGRSTLLKTGVAVRIEELRQDVLRAGTTYFVPAGELHMAELYQCEAAITLVVTHEKGGQPITIGPRDGPTELFAARSLLSDRSLVELGLRAALLL
jgi:hypothetical protein